MLSSISTIWNRWPFARTEVLPPRPNEGRGAKATASIPANALAGTADMLVARGPAVQGAPPPAPRVGSPEQGLAAPDPKRGTPVRGIREDANPPEGDIKLELDWFRLTADFEGCFGAGGCLPRMFRRTNTLYLIAQVYESGTSNKLCEARVEPMRLKPHEVRYFAKEGRLVGGGKRRQGFRMRPVLEDQRDVLSRPLGLAVAKFPVQAIDVRILVMEDDKNSRDKADAVVKAIDRVTEAASAAEKIMDAPLQVTQPVGDLLAGITSLAKVNADDIVFFWPATFELSELSTGQTKLVSDGGGELAYKFTRA